MPCEATTVSSNGGFPASRENECAIRGLETNLQIFNIARINYVDILRATLVTVPPVMARFGDSQKVQPTRLEDIYAFER
jgi:hypothetical protein